MCRRSTLLFAGSALLVLGCKNDYGFGEGPDVVLPGYEGSDGGSGGDGTPDGSSGDSAHDAWDLSDGRPSDIIIYGDTSGSMREELQTMGSNVLAFTDRLRANSSDWHLMAVTGPSGCAVNGWLDEHTADFDALFADAIVTKPNPDDEDEMGLQNVQRAIEQADGGCNDGFLRADALLHVIFISDENDESPGYQTAGYWQDYYDEIARLKGGEDGVRFSAVGGPVPSGCAGADPAHGYAEIVDFSLGGQFVSICSNWPARLDDLADASVDFELYRLSQIPVPASIVVKVNQAAVTEWTYITRSNAVRFDPDHAPTGGDLVDITYTLE